MTSAKQEFLSITEGKDVQCAYIEYALDWDNPNKQISLRVGYREDEWEAFLQKLDFIYDDGYGSQVLFGTIWFTDGTWADRAEYDGSEWWVVRKRPDVPAALIADALDQWGISQSESEENLNP